MADKLLQLMIMELPFHNQLFKERMHMQTMLKWYLMKISWFNKRTHSKIWTILCAHPVNHTTHQLRQTNLSTHTLVSWVLQSKKMAVLDGSTTWMTNVNRNSAPCPSRSMRRLISHLPTAEKTKMTKTWSIIAVHKHRDKKRVKILSPEQNSMHLRMWVLLPH